jgi:hypothetical protein
MLGRSSADSDQKEALGRSTATLADFATFNLEREWRQWTAVKGVWAGAVLLDGMLRQA